MSLGPEVCDRDAPRSRLTASTAHATAAGAASRHKLLQARGKRTAATVVLESTAYPGTIAVL